jgi:hypothetical protein
MLRSLAELRRYTVTATDGDVGTVVNFLFDDERWAIRYLVVKTGGFFDERRVLVSPLSLRAIDWGTRKFHLNLTQDKIRRSPSVDVHKPVSRQYELDHSRYYGYPYYWSGMEMGGPGGGPGYYPLQEMIPGSRPPCGPADPSADVHLRSVKEVRGYRIEGTDRSIGFVADFIVDGEAWEVRYLLVATSHGWWGHKVLIAPRWASDIDWARRHVCIDLRREAIKSSPSWDPTSVIGRDYEQRLHDHYERRGYWGGAPRVGRSRDGTSTPPTLHPT